MNDQTPQADVSDAVQATLDWEALDARLERLRRAAHIIDIVAKTSPGSFDAEELESLSEARRRLRAGELLGAQIRYTMHGQNWCDTFLVRPHGIVMASMPEPEFHSCC